MDSWRQRKLSNYREGLSNIDFPTDEIARVSDSMLEGKLPDDVITTVLECPTRVLNLHPDKYPWSTVASDDIYMGLSDQGINSAQVWRYVEAKAKSLGKRLPAIIDTSKPEQALSNLFEIYSLIRYHQFERSDKVTPIRHPILLMDGKFPMSA